MKQRSTFWDNYKGILILLVVFGHFIYSYASKKPESLANDLYLFIYSFHMPAFIFCSGYFSRSARSRSWESMVQLLLYYLVFNTLMLVFAKVYRGIDFKFLDPYYSYWYILSLVAWRAAIGQLEKVRGLVLLSVLVTLLMGFIDGFPRELSIRRTIAFFPFFAAGYLVNKEKVEHFLNNRKPWQMLLWTVPVAVAAAAAYWAANRFQLTETVAAMFAYTSRNTMLHRLLMMVISTAAIISMLLVVPSRKIPLLSLIGRNSLLIYLAHRFITMVFYFDLFPAESYTRMHLVYAAIATVITCAVFGIEPLNQAAASLCKKAAAAMVDRDSKLGNWLKAIIILIFILLLAINARPELEKIADTVADTLRPAEEYTEAPTGVTGPVDTQSAPDGYLTAQQEADLENAVKLAFVGDLLLLKDQVEHAYDEATDSYDFSCAFEYAAPYLQDADLAIGVFEGPAAGAEAGYSNSIYNDARKIYLNFPDEFAQAVKDAGIDLVTTATNHLLDKDLDGALRTLDVLDEVGLLHTGSYRNQEEQDELMIVEVEGVKIAVLAYLKSINYYPVREVYEDTPYLTSFIPFAEHEYSEEWIAQIEEDFAQAKESGADLIVVLPHLGEQGSHATTDFQDRWNQFFAEQGADLILTDHAHAVQPLEYIGDTLVVNCPGNFLNSYIADDGDANAIVEIYIDPAAKEVIGSSVVPLYTNETEDGCFRALPIYDIVNDEDLYAEMKKVDIERIKDAHELVTEVMVGQAVSLYDVRPRYYFIDGQYLQEQRMHLKSVQDYADRELYRLIDEADSITFIGDSITEGTKNDGHPWYEPMMADFEGKQITNISKGGYPSKKLLAEFGEDILASGTDLYVVAIGTNDVRYRNEKTCAMTAEEYAETMDEMASLIRQSNPDAKIVFLAPWMTLDNDPITSLDHETKNALTDEYSAALAAYAAENGHTFIDANGYLRDFFADAGRRLYTNDGIHPNATLGLELYSMAVLECSP